MRLKLFRSSGSPRGLRSSTFALSPDECWWRDRYSFLQSRGYRLRERLHPDWVPSWTKSTGLRPEDCEDSAYNYHPLVTDATRISDDSKVVLKRVAKNSNEVSIAVFLSTRPQDSHCVPIIETFDDDTESEIEFIVMPLLRKFDSPPFLSVIEVIDFVRQTLKGIAFIHSENVAHRDCSDLNIMLDGSPLYPEGFHPIHQDFTRDGKRTAKHCVRSAAANVTYYFTDFGLSTRFDNSNSGCLVTGRICQADVPELSDVVPYDPYAVDIYLLGDVYKRHFIDRYCNVHFLKPLIVSMVRKIPGERPKAGEALKCFEELVSQQTDYALRWQLLDFRMGRIKRFIVNLECIGREGSRYTKGLLGVRPISCGLVLLFFLTL